MKRIIMKLSQLLLISFLAIFSASILHSKNLPIQKESVPAPDEGGTGVG